MLPRSRPVSVPVSLPHPALPEADWADCYILPVAGGGLTAAMAAERTIGHFPFWVDGLLLLRNIAVLPFGLKGARATTAKDQAFIGIFPVLFQSDEQLVLGFDDTHLDFRIVVELREAGEAGQLASVTTLVRRKILLGKLYIAMVTPFHRLIVKSQLSKLALPRSL